MSRFTLSRALSAAERAGFAPGATRKALDFLDWLMVPTYSADELYRMRLELVLAGVRVVELVNHPGLIVFVWGEYLERQIQRRFDLVCHG